MHYGRDTFAMRVEGHSMEPRVRDGDHVFVDPDEPARHGRFVAVLDGDGEGVLVRLLVEEDGARTLRTLQPGWPDLMINESNETDILGVVVFVGAGV